MRVRAKATTSAPAAILQEVRQTVGVNVAVEMPSTSAIRQTIHRIRKKDLPVEPERAEDVVIPNNLKLTQAGARNFLLFDTNTDQNDELEDEHDGTRIIGFGTEENLRRLGNSDVWFLDGTFKTCPRLFQQIFTINYLFRDTCFPAVYVLMTGRTQEMYVSMLERLLSAAEEMGIELDPTFMIVDFELASINALQQTFPRARVSGCLFHLRQSIYRSVQRYGLVDEYRRNDNVSLSVRKLTALAFLPSDEIEDAFIALSNIAPREVEQVYKYFGETYVLGRPIVAPRKGRPPRCPRRHAPRFPPHLWSIHHLQVRNLPRTNNNLEAWHRRFETVVERCHLGVYSVIREFIKEDHRTDQEVERLIAGNAPRKKKREQLQREERLATVFNRLGTIPTDDYLRGVAHNMHFSLNNPNENEVEDHEDQ